MTMRVCVELNLAMTPSFEAFLQANEAKLCVGAFLIIRSRKTFLAQMSRLS